MLKPFQTNKRLIELLGDRGMVIEDKSFAELYLTKRNYYRLNVYFHKFMQNNSFEKRVSFKDIVKIEDCDSSIRHILFRYIEYIELRLRTQIGYFIAESCGADAFYHRNCFIHERAAEGGEFITNCRNKIFQDFHNDPVIIHHNLNYAGLLPVWVTIEYITFGNLSKLLNLIDSKIQSKIASNFGIKSNILKNWIQSLVVIRNLCAHHNSLFRTSFRIRPAILHKHSSLGLVNGIFANIYCILQLLTDSERARFKREIGYLTISIDELKGNCYKLKIGDYGFPANWDRYLT